MMGALCDLRIHPVRTWVRATSGGVTVVDTRDAALVWEPRRVVASYAVPRADVTGDLVPWDGTAGAEHAVRIGHDGPSVLDPRTPFSVHTAAGRAWSIATSSGVLEGAAFVADDPDLDGLVVLDWSVFDEWREEEERAYGHPRDPYHRIDCLRSSRHVTLSIGGQVVADTRRPTYLYETNLPPRVYVPAEDVRTDLLSTSPTITYCAYKGRASYFSLGAGDARIEDVAWTYEAPLHDGRPVAGLICFYAERFDETVDGVPQERPVTPWS